MKQFSTIATLLIFLLSGAAATRAQNRSAESPSSADSRTYASVPISREQADAILNELRQIHLLLDRQNQRLALIQPSRPASGPEKIIVNLAEAKQWHSQGKEEAPVTIIEFTDYQCPYCRRFDQSTFADIKRNYIDTGKVRFLTRDLPLEFHPNSLRAAEAARCAGDQGKFWEMREALFANSTDLSRDAIAKYAQTLSVDPSSFASCLDTEKHKAEVQADLAEAVRLRVTGTPTFLVGRTANGVLEGVRISGALPFPAFDAAIKQMLGGGQ